MQLYKLFLYEILQGDSRVLRQDSKIMDPMLQNTAHEIFKPTTTTKQITELPDYLAVNLKI